MNNIVCYTCITGGYDALKDVLVKPKNIDFVCFSDRNFRSYTWDIWPIPKELCYLSNVKKQRIVKICPHKYLREYDISIWVDGNILIKGDLNKFIAQYDLLKTPFYTRIHPSCNCIYDEMTACLRAGKDKKEIMQPQIDKYRAEGYPAHIGMAETNIILRKHNEPDCVKLGNLWASELLKHSHRDQLSFNYACWKLHFLPGYLTKNTNLVNNKDKFFNWNVRHG